MPSGKSRRQKEHISPHVSMHDFHTPYDKIIQFLLVVVFVRVLFFSFFCEWYSPFERDKHAKILKPTCSKMSDVFGSQKPQPSLLCIIKGPTQKTKQIFQGTGTYRKNYNAIPLCIERHLPQISISANYICPYTFRLPSGWQYIV